MNRPRMRKHPTNRSMSALIAGSEEPVVKSLHLELLVPVDWQMLRAARLEALRDSPYAFTSTYALESEWGEREWRRMFNAGNWIVARDTEKVIGLARSIGEVERSSTRHVECIWVAPTHRRRGVLRALLQTLAHMEWRVGVTDLLLWVLENNDTAQRAYQALGFQPTGERQFLPACGQFERRLHLVVGPLQDFGPTGRRVGVDNDGAKLGQRPRLQAEEVHSVASAPYIRYSVGELLPVVEIIPPGVDEVCA
jgi:ribosomal protein S18 acetylase RimI-like enzyme